MDCVIDLMSDITEGNDCVLYLVITYLTCEIITM